MRVIENREFGRPPYPPGLYWLPDPLEDVELRRCRFVECQHPAQRTVEARPHLRRVSLTRCHVEVSDLGPVVAQDCTLETIWFHRGKWGPQKIGGCALRHVTIRGNVTGALTIQYPHWIGSATGPADENPYVVANRTFYRDVDWALDISEARFTGFDMWRSDIPARLVRRDAETQAVITRTKLLDERWTQIDLPDPSVGIGIEWFLKTGFADTVLVACKRGRHFDAELETIELLRREGIAEPD